MPRENLNSFLGTFSCFSVVKSRILCKCEKQRILDFTTQNAHPGQEKSGARKIKSRFDVSKIKIFTSDKNEARDFCVNLQFLQSFGSDSA